MSEPSTQPGDERQTLGADVILPLLAVALTVYYLIDTSSLTWEARATGVIVGMVLLALSVVQIARVALRVLSGHATFGLGTFGADTPDNRRRLGLVAIAAAFIGTIDIVGTSLGLFLSLYAGMWILGVRRQTQLVGVAFGTAAAVYALLILLLGSRLPRGLVENGLAMLGIGASG